MIRFGPSGNSEIFYNDGNKSSLQAPAWLKAHRLTAYEYSFGHGFNMKEELAQKLGEEAVKNDVQISVHAPYYISLGNPNEETILKNCNYILKSLSFLRHFNGLKCVIHPGSCGTLPREEAINILYRQLDFILENFYQSGYDNYFLCPETMGKSQQLGSVKEIVEICKRDRCLIPTFDFGHINAVTQGSLKTKDDYRRIIDYSLDELGKFKTDNLHIHFSKIEYTSKGESKHLTLDDTVYGPEFEPLAEVLSDYNLSPTIICESKGMMMEDAIKLKNIYESIGRK